MKKPILAVWMEEEDGKSPEVYWEFGEDVKCYPLIGVLESIKRVLLDMVDEGTEESDKKKKE